VVTKKWDDDGRGAGRTEKQEEVMRKRKENNESG
jgi:hypothetical protein